MENTHKSEFIKSEDAADESKPWAAVVERIAASTYARERGEADTQQALQWICDDGLGRLRMPQAHGGRNISLTTLYDFVLDLAEADSNIPHILRNHFAFVEKVLRAEALPQYKRWSAYLDRGDLFGLGASELGTQNIGDGDGNTVLRNDGDGFRLDGIKYYSTGNLYFDHIVVNAKTSAGEFVAARVGVRQKGVHILEDWDGIGQRFTASGTTEFHDVAVEAADVLYLEDEFQLPFQATFAQLYLTTIVAGILRRIAKDAIDLVRSRKRNYYHAVDSEPARDPLLQQSVGRLSSAAFMAESAVLRAAGILEAAFDSIHNGRVDDEIFKQAALSAAQSKVIVDDLALNSATHLFDVGGGSATKRSALLDRHWRNIRTISSHNPVAYKARILGDHLINQAPLPTGAFF